MTGFAVAMESPAELAAVAARISRLVGTRPAEPVMAGALLTADDDLRVEGYDGETALARVVAATVHGTGQVLVSARLLADIAKHLPQKHVTLAVRGDRMHIDCGGVHSQMPVIPSDLYPQRPALPDIVGEVDARELAEACSFVEHAAHGGAESELINVIGVHLHVPGAGDGSARLYATDRYRFAMRELGYTPTLDADQGLQIRLAHLPLADAARAAQGGTVRLAVDERVVGLVSDRETVVLRRLESAKVGFERVLRGVQGHVVTVATAELVAAAKRAQLHGGKEGVAVVTAEDGELRIGAASPDLGSTEEKLSVMFDGPAVRFGIRPSYLVSAVGAVDTDQVAVTVPPAPSAPMMLRAATSDEIRSDRIQVVMPRNLALHENAATAKPAA